ncbi:MAG: hypothetical protein RMJ28_00140 [Nitrososphaerota archaeon]|nr:hypothetical protein [Candidatus Calditenuaceae archaeon]MDW8072641.1 hypothetical protein [Nitrososphaerota archaeon]
MKPRRINVEERLRELSSEILRIRNEYLSGALNFEEYLRLRSELERRFRNEAEAILRREGLRKR